MSKEEFDNVYEEGLNISENVRHISKGIFSSEGLESIEADFEKGEVHYKFKDMNDVVISSYFDKIIIS